MSRNDGRSTRLRHRPSRTVPALIVAILLLALGVALAWLAVARLVDGTWSTLLQGARDGLAGLRWNSASLWGAGVAAVVLGLVLLACALLPGAFNALSVRNANRDTVGGETDTGPGVLGRETVMSRRAVAHLARAHCVQIDGVRSATATVSNRRVNLKVKTSLRETDDLRTRITDAVRERLDTVGLDPVPRVITSIETTG